MYKKQDHTFVVCAYGKSAFLEECIKSLKVQKVHSNIIVATSTPNEHIKGICEKHGLPLYINDRKEGIAADWNFAYELCDKKLVTLAHQDDIYCENYVEEILKAINKSDSPLIAFSDYGELRGEVQVNIDLLLRVKRILLFPMRFKFLQRSIWVRRRVLALGNAICCPSVTFVKENLKTPIFEPGMKSNIDWEAWEKISRYSGSFVYCSQSLMYHRIHEASTTTDIIKGGQRSREDLEIFKKFWPNWFAGIWEKIYRICEKSNDLK